MLTVDRFTVDDSIVDDSIVEARDFVTDSKAFTNINPTLLMNISYHNKVKLVLLVASDNLIKTLYKLKVFLRLRITFYFVVPE